MKRSLVLCVVVFVFDVIGNAVPKSELLRNEKEMRPDGYSFRILTSDGLKQEEEGHIEGDNLKVKGVYTFTFPDGTNFKVNYTAGVNGYVAQVRLRQVLVPSVKNRIPSAAIGSLAGGGLG